jgi:hypothetical protein
MDHLDSAVRLVKLVKSVRQTSLICRRIVTCTQEAGFSGHQGPYLLVVVFHCSVVTVLWNEMEPTAPGFVEFAGSLALISHPCEVKLLEMSLVEVAVRGSMRSGEEPFRAFRW